MTNNTQHNPNDAGVDTYLNAHWEDYKRQIDEKTHPEHEILDPHEVDHGTLYYKMHWGAYKGHVRGLVRGLIVGSVMGALVGLGIAGLGAIGVLGFAASLSTLTLAAGFASLGGILASEIMGRVGNAAGNVASQLAELELRERYPELPEITPDSPQPGYGHHYEVPPERDRGKLFHPRVAAAGALLVGAFGGLVGLSGVSHIIGELTLGLAAGVSPLAPVAMGALFGMSFGINRSVFKSIFNFTDGLFEGKLTGPTLDDLAKDRERYRLQGESVHPPVINSLQRQEEYYRLQNEYFKIAFSAGFSGNARGLVGGSLSGGVAGLALGGVAAVACLLAASLFTVTLPFTIPALISLTTAAGIAWGGLKFHNEASFEASGHSNVHEVFHERLRQIEKGHDIPFAEAEKIVEQRRQSDPNLTPPDAERKHWIKPRIMAVMATIGAVVGAGLSPILGSGIGHLLHLHHISTAASASIFGLTGATFGLGSKITDALHNLGDRIYMGSFFPGDQHPEIKVAGEIPLMSHRSELAHKYIAHQRHKAPQTKHHQHQGGMAAEQYKKEMPQPRSSKSMEDILNRGERKTHEYNLEADEIAAGLTR